MADRNQLQQGTGPCLWLIGRGLLLLGAPASFSSDGQQIRPPTATQQASIYALTVCALLALAIVVVPYDALLTTEGYQSRTAPPRRDGVVDCPRSTACVM